MMENMDRHDVPRFYANINGIRLKTAPVSAIRTDREQYLLTENIMAVTRLKDHFLDLRD